MSAVETRRIGLGCLLWASLFSAIMVVSCQATPFPRYFASSDSVSQRGLYFPQQRHHHALLQNNRHNNEVIATRLSLLKELRGGGAADEADAANDDDDEISMDTSSTSSSVIMSKLRNIIRSVLKVGEKKSPSLAKTLRSVLKSLEDMLGVELLPKSTKRKKGRKKSKETGNNKKAKKAAVEEEADTESDSDETATKQMKKAKAAAAAISEKPSAATSKHLTQKLTIKNPNYRIQKELKDFIKEPPPNLSVKVGKNMRVWIVTMVGAENTIYEGEVYRLRICFPKSYPTMPPSVYFMPPNIPKHEHVYTNGDICLSLLGKDWRPIMTAQSIASSILSILSSAQSKSIPMDNAKHAQNKPGQYQQDWVYHDDQC